MKRHLFVLCAVAFACTARATPAFAQASALGSSFAIYGAVSRGSAVAYDTRNHVYLVVSAYGTVSARFVSADGTALPYCISSGSNFTVGGAAFGHFPRVGYSPDANGGLGGFMVTWHEGDSVASGNAVHARAVSLAGCVGVDRIISNTIDANGAVIGGDKTWWEAGPAIAYSTRSQRWLVVWRSIVSADGQFNDVNGRILDLSGQPLGFSTVKVTYSSGYEDNPSVAYNPTTDEFLVTYSGEDGTSPYVAAKRVTSAGIVGPGYVLSRASGTYITDTTYVASTGNYFSAWHQVPGGATGYVVNGVTGAPEGAPIPLSTRFTANDAMSVAYNALSGTSFLVSHDQLTSEDGGFEISAAGVPSAGFGTTSIGGKGNYYPRIAASSVDKRWMMVTANNFAAIFGQFISSTSASAAPPPAAPPALTAVPVTVTGLPANVILPVNEGTGITWTAVTSGGTGPLSYQFMRYTEGVGWTTAQAYSSSNTYTWFPSAGTHAVQVWVKSAGSSAAYDAYLGSGTFTVLGPAPTGDVTQCEHGLPRAAEHAGHLYRECHRWRVDPVQVPDVHGRERLGRWPGLQREQGLYVVPASGVERGAGLGACGWFCGGVPGLEVHRHVQRRGGAGQIERPVVERPEHCPADVYTDMDRVRIGRRRTPRIQVLPV